MTTVEQAETDLIARTRALIPELRERAEATAAARRVPPENIRALQAAGSLKTVQARRNGGYGLGMHAHLDTISSIAEGCGSTAWVSGVVHAHSWLLSHFPAQGQDDVYGADPDSVVAAVIGPAGRRRGTPTAATRSRASGRSRRATRTPRGSCSAQSYATRAAP